MSQHCIHKEDETVECQECELSSTHLKCSKCHSSGRIPSDKPREIELFQAYDGWGYGVWTEDGEHYTEGRMCRMKTPELALAFARKVESPTAASPDPETAAEHS